MSILANVKTDTSIQEDTDTVGSSGPIESGLYLFTVAMAYLQVAASGAIGLVLHLANNGRETKQTLWIQSGDLKGNKNFYEDKKTGAKKYLPGFNMANNLALLTVGKEISALAEEEKVVKIWSYADSKDIDTKVPMLTELLGQEILGGMIRQIVNKQVKSDNGKYVDDPTGDTRRENELDKFFRAKDRLTVAEIKDSKTEGAFAAVWEAKWSGNDRNRVKTVPKSTSAKSIQFDGASQAVEKPTESLFPQAS